MKIILQKLRGELDKLTIYCRSIYSADCSRGEGEKERNTHYYLSKCCNAQIELMETERLMPFKYCAKCQKCGEPCEITPVIDNK